MCVMINQPFENNLLEGNGPPTPVSISDVRMIIHDTVVPYTISDAEIAATIKTAMISAKYSYNICVDSATGYPATDIDTYIALLITVIQLLENYTIRVKGGSGSGQCSSAGYVAFVDSISEGGSSISFLSFGDLQTILETKRAELDRLKLSRWGCAIRVTTNNY